MALVYPVCSAPSFIQISQTAADTIRVQWQGVASTYKVAWKKETEEAWQTMEKHGEGSAGGSGYFFDDTPASSIPSGINPSADFSISPLSVGLYDFRLINICSDSTDYTVKKKFLLTIAQGAILNLRFAPDPGEDLQANIMWDAPTIDSGEDYIVSWCKIDQFGKNLYCDNAVVPYGSLAYSIHFTEKGRYNIFVSQPLATATNQAAVSEILYKNVSDGSCEVEDEQLSSSVVVSGTQVIGEVPSGAVDGVNTTFFTANSIATDSEEVKINGLAQTRGVHYTVQLGNRIVFTTAPLSGRTVTVNYIVL